MGLDITVLIADSSWLAGVPPRERLPRLRDAWHADETGLWDHDVPAVEGGWVWPEGPDSAFFGVYEFLNTLGSFKAHFWAAQRWESFREHVEPPLQADVDSLLLGLVWSGLDGEAQRTDTGFFSDDGYGMLLARSAQSVRELAATWDRVCPDLGRMRAAFTEHAAVDPGAWISDFGEFAELLTQWGYVLTEAARRGWCVVGLSE